MSNTLLTLAEAKKTQQTAIEQGVISEFQKGSRILDVMPFDPAVACGGSGSTLTYGYSVLKTPSSAAFRNINEEYTPNMAVREAKTAQCKIFGGAWKIDRVIDDTSGALREMNFQMQEKIEGAINLFNYNFINGDSSKNPKEFDGLKKLLEGSDTEYKMQEAIDLSSESAIEQNKDYFIDVLDDFLSTLKVKPDMLIGNSKLIGKIKSVARRLGYFSQSEDSFGRTIDRYDGIELVDLGVYDRGGQAKDVVEIKEDGTTSLYAISFGENGVHGISPQGNKLIRTYGKDVTDTGVMREGEIEAIMGIVIKDTKKAGVLTNIKIKNPAMRGRVKVSK